MTSCSLNRDWLKLAGLLLALPNQFYSNVEHKDNIMKLISRSSGVDNSDRPDQSLTLIMESTDLFPIALSNLNFKVFRSLNVRHHTPTSHKAYHPVSSASSALSMNQLEGRWLRRSCVVNIHMNQSVITTIAQFWHRRTHFSACV